MKCHVNPPHRDGFHALHSPLLHGAGSPSILTGFGGILGILGVMHEEIMGEVFETLRFFRWNTLWETNSLLWKMGIGIVVFPIKKGDNCIYIYI